MATTRAKSTAAKKTAAAKVETETKKEAVKETKRVIDNNTPVVCKNGTHGNLIYKSTRNLGYEVEWSEFGEEQQIEFGELLVMRGSQRRFFENNWIIIEDPEVLKRLGVERFYKDVPAIDKFDELFKGSPEQIKKKISSMSEGMKDSVRIRAKELIMDGELDSMAVIKAVGEAVGCDLTE